MPGYKVEYALSGRAQCKKCSSPIAQGELRVGKLVQAANFDGEYPLWHHYACFFTRFGKDVRAENEFRVRRCACRRSP